MSKSCAASLPTSLNCVAHSSPPKLHNYEMLIRLILGEVKKRQGTTDSGQETGNCGEWQETGGREKK